MEVFQVAAANANLASRLLPSGTGGSWKKSPVTTSCIPPKGRPLFLMRRAISSSLSKRSPSTMDTSSTIRTLVRIQRLRAF
ncbi:uncharacterized protein BO96DRAFT_352366 [Aspergillus niger CBS 101883]|uniref:uncharacterized protein n=1 Tax=Aspergillus lacticoffeatus (strain CBS 101883) TaxID=1450533 RepID=UPI000D7FE917|nr:uncharacterized protein BO96DRAFT_352366 [Aspergillus niger CBS 101883]PYH50503.1 hypothetical protein BO96DRAFT_352366 [Aspergillus niger CBS 101883]